MNQRIRVNLEGYIYLVIYIKETFHNNNLVVILVDGILDEESIQILKEVCYRHFQGGNKIELNLEGLIHISREGKDFLRDIWDKVSFVRYPDSI